MRFTLASITGSALWSLVGIVSGSVAVSLMRDPELLAIIAVVAACVGGVWFGASRRRGNV